MTKHLNDLEAYKHFYLEDNHVKLRPIRDFFRKKRGSLGFLPKVFQALSRHPRYLAVENEISKQGLRNILDVGCGIGTVATLLGHRLGVKISGFDLSPLNVAKAKALCWVKQVSFQVGVAEEDIGKFFPEKSFDGILLLELLEHVMDVEKIINSVKPLLAPGGRILITVPNDKNAHHHTIQHVREFDAENIRQMFGHYPAFHYEELPAVPGVYAGGYFVCFTP